MRLYAEITSDLAGGLFIFGIHRYFFGCQPRERLARSFAASRGVFVEIEANLSFSALRGSFIGLTFKDGSAYRQSDSHRRTSTAFACASKPSAFARMCTSPASDL